MVLLIIYIGKNTLFWGIKYALENKINNCFLLIMCPTCPSVSTLSLNTGTQTLNAGGQRQNAGTQTLIAGT